MTELEFQKQMLDRLTDLQNGFKVLKEEIDAIKEKIVDDSMLSKEDKKDIDEALKEEKEGKLLSKDKVFG